MHARCPSRAACASSCAARDDAVARDQRVHRRAAPAVEIVHELGRRRDLGKGPDRPVAIVEIELRADVGEIDIGLPVGVHRARRRANRRLSSLVERTQERGKRCAQAVPFLTI